MICVFVTATNLATGEEIVINAHHIESMQPFILDGEAHCFVNLTSGRQYKCVESQWALRKAIKKEDNRRSGVCTAHPGDDMEENP